MNIPDYLKTAFEKTNITMGLLCKMWLDLLRSSLFIICKSFVRPHRDYGDIIYDQTISNIFHQKMKAMLH